MSNLNAAKMIQEQLAETFFDVVTEEVVTGSGMVIPGKKVICRADNFQPIAVVGDRYKVVTNEEVFSGFADILSRSDLDLSGAEVKAEFSHNGARTFAQVILPNHTVKVGNGDATALRLIAKNSYDGTTAFSVQAGGYRFVCSNGMIMGTNLSYFTGKHVESLDIKAAARHISGVIDSFHASEDWFNELRATAVNDRQAYACLAHASRNAEAMRLGWVEMDQMPRVMRTLMESWKVHQRQLGKNAWALYNTMTHFSTHWDEERGSNHSNAAAAKYRREDRIKETLASPAWRKLTAK